jgi:hypothetical protein
MTSLLQWAFSAAMPSLNNRAIGFDDMLVCIRNPAKYSIIHTMPATESDLIKGTLGVAEEEAFMNEYLSKYVETPKTIVLYGRNSCDDSVGRKRAQLLSLGISDVYVYVGGMFEWVLLQDIYGEDEFPTTGAVKDILAFRTRRTL